MDNEQLSAGTKPIVWWKDKKLLAGIALVFLSTVLSFYGKGLFIIKFYEPVYLLTGLSIWVFSWILLLLGIFLVGLETVKMIQQRIHYHVKHTIKKTYHHVKELPKKGYHYTKELHRKGFDKIVKTSKAIAEKIKQ